MAGPAGQTIPNSSALSHPGRVAGKFPPSLREGLPNGMRSLLEWDGFPRDPTSTHTSLGVLLTFYMERVHGTFLGSFHGFHTIGTSELVSHGIFTRAPRKFLSCIGLILLCELV